jgi:predicted metal-dependent peptidase
MGMVDQTLEVAVALDTSGSMSNATLADAKRIVHDVYKELGIDDVWYGQCDTKMTQPFKRMPLKTLLAAPVVGRGGTDFRPIFAAAAKLSPKPDVLLVLTDGYGPAPARPIRGIATVWVLVPTDASTCPAGWGHTVVCTEDHKIRKQLAHK